MRCRLGGDGHRVIAADPVGNADEIGTERRYAVGHLVENSSPGRTSRWPEVVKWQATHTRQHESAGNWGWGGEHRLLGELPTRGFEQEEHRRVLRKRTTAPV